MLITTEQAKEHLKLNATLNEESFAPFIPDAEQKYIKPFLGNDLFDLLDTWAEDKDEEDAELKNLYNQVIPVLARFTLLIASPHLDVNIGESGFTVQGSSTLVPASTERVKRFMESTEILAWDNMETLLRFLEENQTDYPEWVASDAYTMATKNLVNSATEFNKYVNIDSSRLTFHRLRCDITNIEEIDVVPLISQELYDSIISKLRGEGSLTDPEKKLLQHLKAFVVNKTAFSSLNRINNGVIATFHYNKAREIVNKTPDDFPLFKESTSYDQSQPPFRDWENSQDKSIFVA